MTKVRIIESPSGNIKTFKVSSLSKITDSILNACVKEKISPAPSVKEMGVNFPTSVTRFYNVGNKKYAHCIDGVVYEWGTGAPTAVCEGITSPPVIAEIVFGGANVPLIIGEYGITYIGKEQRSDYDMPHGSGIEVFMGRIFTFLGNYLYYSKGFNFSTYSHTPTLDGFIRLSGADESIKGIVAFSDYMIVVSKTSIYKLTANDSTLFKLERFETPPLNISFYCVKDMGDEIVIFSDGGIFSFKQGKIKRIESLLDDGNYAPVSIAVSDGRSLYLPVKEQKTKSNYVYYIDREFDFEALISAPSVILGDGAVFEVNGALKTLKKDGETLTDKIYWLSKAIDFDSPCPKNVVQLSLYASNPAVLSVYGDFGEKNVQLKEGLNVLRVNLFSKTIKLKIIAEQRGFSASDLQIKYKLHGE